MSIKVITVSRQFGSGGRTVAKLVADKLGWAYYDKELVRKIAAESGLAESYILDSGEYACSTNSFLFNWAMSAESGRNPGTLPVSDQLYIVQNNVIRDLAEKGNCVIVGRCADDILREMNPLRIFVYGDMETKLERCRKRAGSDEKMTDREILSNIRKIDKNRSEYYGLYTGKVWGDKQSYDLCINTSKISVERASELLAEFVR